MFTILGVLSILIAIALILVVIVQNSKGGGLSSTFGSASGATQLLGSRRSNEAIEKFTWYLAGGLALVVFLANIIGYGGTNSTSDPRMRSSIENQILEDPIAVPDVENLAVPETGGDAEGSGE